MAETTVDEAVKRNCDALVAGNITQLFIDMTPEAMAKLSQSAGASMGGGIPTLTSYEIVSRTQEGEDYLYDVRFQGDVRFGVRARWREVTGAWKLADFEPYQYE